MRYIYRFKNKINGKKYIGQTNNVERRLREYKSSHLNENSSSYNDLICLKLREYGWDSFEFSVLEEVQTDIQSVVDEREIYWISRENSYVGDGFGYNKTRGGQFTKRIDSKTLSSEQIKEVKKMLINGIDYGIIASKFNISKTFISNINHGFFFKEDVKYPLCDYGRVEEEKIQLLIFHLRDSELTFLEIAKTLNISEATVKKINYGRLRQGLVDDYPIRKITPQQKKANLTIELLLDDEVEKKDISLLAGVSEETVRRINLGITNKKDNLTYPLRKTVETIPG